MNPYIYTPDLEHLDTKLYEEDARVKRYYVKFESAIDTGYIENSLVAGEYYLPKIPGKRPLAVLVHGMGDTSLLPVKHIAGSLLKRGIACFVLYLTIHSKRLPGELKEHLFNLTPEQWYRIYRVSVIDIRQVLDWAATRPELDGRSNMVLGISFGGFVSSICMGVDERIRNGIFIVSGGNSLKINRLGRNRTYHRPKAVSELEYRQEQKEYFNYLDAVYEQGFENVSPARQNFLIDPMTFAGRLKSRPVQMINATRDRYIPAEAVKDFWNASGRPPIKWIPAGHVSIWWWYPAIIRCVNGFAGDNLLNSGPTSAG